MTQAPKIRLYVPQPLHAGALLALGEGQSHYLAHVMRCREGDAVAVFNGQDGEWLAEMAMVTKKSVSLALKQQLKSQKPGPDVWLAFAPIKNKTDLIVEKATELGASRLWPVLTRHGVVKSINDDKMRAHAAEAAEQSERLDVPMIETLRDLPSLLVGWPPSRPLFYGDESGAGVPLKTLLSPLRPGAFGLLVGPEGGFSASEHALLKAASFVRPFCMGPRILRADTAAVAALACLQMWAGDWDEAPRFTAEA